MITLNGTEVVVTLISTVGVVITALLGFLGTEARKGRKALGVSHGRTVMGVLENIAASVGEQAAHNLRQDERLQTIETDVHEIGGRVLSLEEMAQAACERRNDDRRTG